MKEEELLEVMIRDRETQLSMIKRKMEEQTKKLERVKIELDETQTLLNTETVSSQMESETLHNRHFKLVKNYKETKDSLDMKKQQQGQQLHIYNEVMKNVASPESRDSSYVMRMQAQLCKAMHSMGMVETQLALATNQSEQNIKKFLKEQLTLNVEEKSQIELKLMNELVMADTERRKVETKHKDMIDSFNKEKDGILERIEKQQELEKIDDGEEGGEGEGGKKAKADEDEDDEEKEELQEILTQGREEIERMEAENKTELEKLEQLKQKVTEVKGEGFVEELVSSIAEEFKERDQGDEDSEEED